jgi:8-hydroxy-5-deazaflavin:NADPH oxidoreductase
MRIGVLGSGMAGRTIASRLIELGHEVRMGSRNGSGGAAMWARTAGARASAGDYADAAGFGELIVNASPGAHSLEVLRQATDAALAGKVLLDVANPISPEGGGRAILTVANTDSLAEQIQREFPQLSVVKALNTMNATVMVRPETVPGDHVVFVRSDDEDARRLVTGLLEAFGWPPARIVDLGRLATARGTEAFVLLWLGVWNVVGPGDFNIAIARSAAT